MLKFISGAVIGAGVVYALLVYPVQSKAALTTVQGAANSVASTVATWHPSDAASSASTATAKK